MSYLKLNGIEFQTDVAISQYRIDYNVLDGDNTGRSQAKGSMIREIIGLFPQYKITCARKGNNYEGLDALWKFLKEHSMDDYVSVELADGQDTISGDFYYTSFGRDLLRVENGVRYWGAIEITLTAMEAELTP